MARTTVDTDTPLLEEMKKLQKKQRRSLGEIVSQLLAQALAQRKTHRAMPKLRWVSRPMGARVDLADKEAVQSAHDRREK